MSVVVLMVDIRVVRMRVAHGAMNMAMRVRLQPVPIGIVTVLMMHVMHVWMRMLQERVLVGVFMHLEQMQPDAPCHQSCRDDQRCAQRLVL